MLNRSARVRGWESTKKGRGGERPGLPTLRYPKEKLCPRSFFVGAGGLARQTQSVADAGRFARGPTMPPAAPRHTRTVVVVKPTVEHWHAFAGAGFLRSVQIYILTFLAVLPACRHEAPPTGCSRREKGYRRKDRGPFFETPAPLPPRRKPRAYCRTG